VGVWQLTTPNNTYTLTVVSTNVWFGARLLKGEDRLQSVGKYFPYGEDRYNPTPANPSNDQEKFATYTRDSISGLDYALNRYYAAGLGRFMGPDPYVSTNGPREPQGWNRYPYTQGDPINRYDPKGLFECDPEDPSCTPCDPFDPFYPCYTPPCPGPPTARRPSLARFAFDGASDCGDPGGGDPIDARCSISVVGTGTPIDGQSLVHLTTYSPLTNRLGSYSTIGRSSGPQGWFYAVQIRALLHGDTNPADWSASQTKALSGAYTLYGRKKPTTGSAPPSPDDPTIGINNKTKGHFDWLDEPGFTSYIGGIQMTSANLTYSFTSTLTNTSGASCSVSWSVNFTLVRGNWWLFD
jgi:RHS repeat-associated protein